MKFIFQRDILLGDNRSREDSEMNNRTGYWLVFMCIFLPMCGYSGSAFKDTTQEKQLANGLKIIVKEDHRAPIVFSEIWYKVGSSYEPLGLTGISHALEHMMFKGTHKYPAGEFSKIIAENGGSENAFTAYDYTGYYQKLGSDKLSLSFELESDRMKNLRLPAKEFDKEIEVVKEERKLRTDNVPEATAFERFQASAFLSNPYHHPIVGWQSDLDNMTVEDLRRWYQTWYAPNNATLIVVGDVKSKEVFALAEKYFAKLRPSPLPVIKPHPEVKPMGPRNTEVQIPAKIPLAYMGFNVPGITTTEIPWEPYALTVLASVLAGDDSSRLPKELVRKQKIASSIDVGYNAYSRLDDLFTFEMIPAQGNSTEDVEKAIWAQIQTIQEEPVTSRELERVKTQEIASNIYSQDSLYYQARLLGTLESIGLPWQELDRLSDHIRAVTAEQVQAVAKKYLTPERVIITTLVPQPISHSNDNSSEEESNNA